MTTPAELASRLQYIAEHGLTFDNVITFEDTAKEALATIERLSKELEEARTLLSSARADAIEEAAELIDRTLKYNLGAELAARIRSLKTEDGGG